MEIFKGVDILTYQLQEFLSFNLEYNSVLSQGFIMLFRIYSKQQVCLSEV
jgi:hypothetical protein